MPQSGEPGLDIFKMAGKSIKGWLPFPKTGLDPNTRKALPFASLEEHDAGIHMLFDPMAAYAQRADITKSFAAAHRLECRLEVPFIIPYRYHGADHEYYIDWIGVQTDGALFGVEASVEAFKSDDQSQAKLEAAADYFKLKGGTFGLFLPGVVSDLRLSNLRRLASYLSGFDGYDDVAPEIERYLLRTEPISIRNMAADLGPKHGERLVTEAAWRRIAIAATQGRLVVDLDTVLLDLDSPVSLLAPDLPPILAPELPTTIAEMRPVGPPADPEPPSLLPGPTVDPELVPEKHRKKFVRNLNAVRAVLTGTDHALAAKDARISEKHLVRLKEDAQARGEIALRPYLRTAGFQTGIDPVFIEPILRLLRGRQRLTYVQISQAPELRKASDKAFKATAKLPKMPTYGQIWRFCKNQEKDDPATQLARSGLRRLPHSATTPLGYVRTIPSPALVCQVDEHYMDIFVVTDTGAKLTERVHAAVLICVKTAAILGAVLSPRALTDEDYLRLLKQAMEPKDAIVRRSGCGSWAAYGRPSEIMSDRGNIFVSEQSTIVVVDRFGITQLVAPPYAPSVKGTVEALFRWMTERFSHRLPGTTKSSPTDRGTYDSQAEALKAGIPFREFEDLFYRAIVDGYMQDWDELRGGVRYQIWEQDVAQFGVPQSMVSDDERKLLLMRAWNPKHPKGLYLVQGGGVSFKGEWYVGEESLTARLRAEFVGFLFDRRDIGTIYLTGADGTVLGPAHCSKYANRRISVWEQAAERKQEKIEKSKAQAISAGNLTTIVDDAQTRRKETTRLAKEASRAEFLDAQQAEIHPAAVLEERRRIAAEQARGPAWLTDPTRLPGPDDGPSDVVVPFVRLRGRDKAG